MVFENEETIYHGMVKNKGYMIGWSFLNLLDAELVWLSYLTIALTSAMIVSKILNTIFVSLHTRYPSLYLCYQPMVLWIWMLAIFYAIDRVTDHLLTETCGISFTIFFIGTFILNFIRIVLRFKNIHLQKAKSLL